LSVSLSRPRRPSLSASLSLHDALPIWIRAAAAHAFVGAGFAGAGILAALFIRRAARVGSPAAHRLPGPIGVVSAIGRLLGAPPRSEEHTSELQSRENLVCRLLLEKKKK